MMMPRSDIRDERQVGRVVAVTNVRVTVLLDSEARSPVRSIPHRVTWVTQLGAYLLFPVGPGEAAVGVIVGASEDDVIEPTKDNTMTLQLARARRILRLNLVGQLREGQPFIAGISVYPTLDMPALLPTEEELSRILAYHPHPDDEKRDRALTIGHSPIYARHPVKVSFNDVFSRPFGVIGNTGSGKSCSVASIIQQALKEQAEGKTAKQAKFIILDINGEYGHSFSKAIAEGTHVEAPRANSVYVNGRRFHMPLWTFNLTELVAFFDASQASQVPVLERVVTSLREESVDPDNARPLRKILRIVDRALSYTGSLTLHAAEVDGKAVGRKCLDALNNLKQCAESIVSLLKQDQCPITLDLPTTLTCFDDQTKMIFESGLKREYAEGDYDHFSNLPEPLPDIIAAFVEDLEADLTKLRNALITKGGIRDVTADTPVPFSPSMLEQDALFYIAASRHKGEQRIQEYISTLRLRIHRQLSDKRWSIFTKGHYDSFLKFVGMMLGSEDQPITVVDCSMLAYDVLPFFCAVFGRILLDLRSRTDKSSRIVQPYVLVLEEAHNYLRDWRQDEPPGLKLSREAFERIAKEGRKFGLSLIIASQRPSDVSATVLSQCANFLVHRIQNPDDIDYFKKILPLGSRDLLDQLPILAPGDGLFIGSGVNVPARVKMLMPEPKPESETSRPWDAWQPDRPRFGVNEAVNRWLQETDQGDPSADAKVVEDRNREG